MAHDNIRPFVLFGDERHRVVVEPRAHGEWVYNVEYRQLDTMGGKQWALAAHTRGMGEKQLPWWAQQLFDLLRSVRKGAFDV
jgi:hypothetical protein